MARECNARGVTMPDQQETRLGQQIGEYRLIHKLGGGGFGTVYLAEHVHQHTQAAVKVLDIPLSKPEDFRGFINEASMIRLRHPHIVPLLNFGISRDDLPFLVMEYAPAGTLRDRHPIRESVPLPTIVWYVDQLASALQYAHDEHVIHRDVKPANILVRFDGTLLMSDFGIAKLLEQSVLISQQTQVGTPVYMAPEQYMGHPCFASDQYALAVIIYEWICGVQPFQGPALGLAIQHINIPPPRLRDHLPTLPEAVERVVLKALAKAPEDRFGRIQDMAFALREAVQSPLSAGALSQRIETRNTTPLVLPGQESRPVPVPHQSFTLRSHSSPQAPPTNAVTPFPQIHYPSRRFSLFMGGVALALISLVIIFTLIFKPILSALEAPSTPTTRSQPSQPSQPSPSPSVPPSLVGWWTFNTNTVSGTTVLDKSGQGNNGHMINGSPLQQLGMCDQAMEFNGKDWIKIPESTSTVITSSFTIEAWVKVLATGPERTILWKADPRPRADPYFLYIDGTTATVGFDENTSGDEKSRHQAQAEVGNYINQGFFYLTGVFDAQNQTLAIYVNGNQLANQATTATPLADQDGTNVFIGGMDHDDHNMNGILDEVRLYSRALTLNEIKTDMQRCSS